MTSVHISDISAWFNIKFANNTSNPLCYAEHIFLNGEEITNLAIPNGVTTIGNYQFQNCTALTSVIIPNSVTSIGDGAFSGCSRLASVTFGDNLTNIGKDAFGYCSNLTVVNISDIGAWCNIKFYNDASNPLHATTNKYTPQGCLYLNGEVINDLKIPDNVESINDYAFYGCLNLKSVNIPKSVTSIGASAFYKCLGLATVSIPNSITSIGNQAFYGCTSLQRVTIPNSVTSLGNSAFFGCTNLSKVSLGNKIGSIGEYTFSRSAITKIVIPNSVRNIEEYAFHECNSLRAIYIKSNYPPSIKKYTFSLDQNNYITLYIPYGTKSEYNTGFWYEFRKFETWDPSSNDWNVTDAGFSTLYLDYAVDIPEDVEVYIGTIVKNNRIILNRITGVLPAYTAIIIKADKGTYTFFPTNEVADPIYNNILRGTVSDTEIVAESGTSYYVLSAPDGEVAMYRAKLSDGKFLNNANKAYLPISNGDLGIFDDEVDSSVEQLSRRLVFDFGDETGIDEVKTENGKVKTAVYDLSGRRVQKAQKGIYIQNGKLMVK